MEELISDTENSSARLGNPNIRPNIDDFPDNPSQSVQGGLKPHNGVGLEGREEGQLTKQIEALTSKVPSGTFLAFGLASMALSAYLQFSGRKGDAHFVGQWVPTILLLGLYNKIVKLEGSEPAGMQSAAV